MSHPRSIAADVEGGLLPQKLVDSLGLFPEAVLNICPIFSLPREGHDNLNLVSECFLNILETCQLV